MTETAKPSAASAPACPICGKPAQPAFDPFCSKRCADVDLSRWLNGTYAIAGESAEGLEQPDQRPLKQDDAD